ncbi:hypothetical protein AUEXF2481DRAFT_33394 [Aureobasidium subglaciale EXF-2481]|uniref:BHLH domain-containing protein n=1 Tax=Aureobasidium subglaciale (strain EXF-2481) TaxID=1043005 RepID=A0A074XZU8_AURSE|nr:uncharacterized protein AUEXF2481DRAFT_33394 [Aureobasidium subglaciale EXF-2481]KEQ91073.1 hypothetical protein AUEXF2481DRAFT_33394 [Aureobasidium subglaciale EXF-2481]
MMSPARVRSNHASAERKYQNTLRDRIRVLNNLLGEILEADCHLGLQPKSSTSKAATLHAATDMLHRLHAAFGDEVKRQSELESRLLSVVTRVSRLESRQSTPTMIRGLAPDAVSPMQNSLREIANGDNFANICEDSNELACLIGTTCIGLI